MPNRNWRLRIEDMLKAADRCRRYVGGMDYGTFAVDQQLIDAVVRNLEIIGEAARCSGSNRGTARAGVNRQQRGRR